MMAMVRTQLQLTDKQARELKELAAREGVPMAEPVRQAANRLLEGSGTLSVQERRRRAMGLVGQLRLE